MQPLQCNLQPEIQETHRTTHTGTINVAKHIEGTKRPQPQPPHTRGTFHRRLQPLYTEKRKVSCSGFLPNSPLPFLTASHRHHFPSSPPPFVHFPSSPLPFLTTSHCPHLPSSPFPFIITSLRHHFPSSPLPFVTTSLRHHFPSSPLPFVTTSLRHHPSLSPPFIKVNSTASYSFVMYCYVMYCYVIYHPASFQVAEFYLSVTRKYCFPTSFDNHYKWRFTTINGWKTTNQTYDRFFLYPGWAHQQRGWDPATLDFLGEVPACGEAEVTSMGWRRRRLYGMELMGDPTKGNLNLGKSYGNMQAWTWDGSTWNNLREPPVMWYPLVNIQKTIENGHL